MPVPWPQDDPDAWDTCILGGMTLPGLAKLSLKTSQEIDKKKPKGGAGATLTFQGPEASPVTITLQITTREEFAELQAVLPKLQAKRIIRGRTVEPLSIVHPKAQLHSIRAVAIEEIEDNDKDESDRYSLIIRCVEYYPPAKTSTTKTATKIATQIATQDNALATTEAPTPPSRAVIDAGVPRVSDP